MAEELRWGFKRAGRRRLLIALFFVPFVGAGAFLTTLMMAESRELIALGAYRAPSLTAPGTGEVRLEGVAHREATVTTPTGKRAIGWVGHVGYEKRDSDSDVTFVSVCSRGSFFDIKLRSEASERRVAFARPGDPLTFATGLGAEVPILDVETMQAYDTIPAEMTERCQGSLGPPGAHRLEYREGLIAEGEHVELLACAGPDGVSPCHRGHDLLTTGSLTRRLDNLRRGVTVLGLFAGVWNLLILLVVGLMLLDTIPTGSRQ